MNNIDEVSPPGWSHTKSGGKKSVKVGGTAAAMKKAKAEGRIPKKLNIFALMWSMKNKGDKPHYKPGKRGVLKKKYKKSKKKNESVWNLYSDMAYLLTEKGARALARAELAKMKAEDEDAETPAEAALKRSSIMRGEFTPAQRERGEPDLEGNIQGVGGWRRFRKSLRRIGRTHRRRRLRSLSLTPATPDI